MTTKITASSDGTYGILGVGATEAFRFGADNSGQLASFRNKIINGAMMIAQRGNVSFSSNAMVYGGCDRWLIGSSNYTTVSGTISQAGYIGAPNNTVTGFVQQLLATTTGAGVITFQQRIEAVNVSDLNGKVITVSVSLYQDTGSTISPTLNIYKPNALDNWSASTFIAGTTISLPSGVMTKFTWTVTLGSSDASNGLGLVVNLPTGAVTNKYFQIADVQLEAGSIATPFEHRPIGTELALCQRYYEVGNYYAGYFWTSTWGTVRSDQVTFAVTKRATPTIGGSFSGAGWAGSWSTLSVTPLRFIFTNNATLNAGAFTSVADWNASAEL